MAIKVKLTKGESQIFEALRNNKHWRIVELSGRGDNLRYKFLQNEMNYLDAVDFPNTAKEHIFGLMALELIEIEKIFTSQGLRKTIYKLSGKADWLD